MREPPGPAAAERWAAELEAWSIPEEILARAPEPPWGFPAHLFAAEHTPFGALHRVAFAALDAGGSVLDIGCGGGAASIPLVPPATSLTGVDSLADMLAAYAKRASRTGVPHSEVLGRWPDMAGQLGRSDVIVCRNVVYNVADIVPFVTELNRHAVRKVIVELAEHHPSVPLAPLWMRFWGLPRPGGPTAGLFGEVLCDLGIEPEVEREIRPSWKAQSDPQEHLAFVRRRLCLDPSRDRELAEAMGDESDETTAVVLHWAPN